MSAHKPADKKAEHCAEEKGFVHGGFVRGLSDAEDGVHLGLNLRNRESASNSGNKHSEYCSAKHASNKGMVHIGTGVNHG